MAEKPWNDNRPVRGFPSPDKLRGAALEYIAGVYMSGSDHYLPGELKDGVASILGITNDQRAIVNQRSKLQRRSIIT